MIQPKDCNHMWISTLTGDDEAKCEDCGQYLVWDAETLRWKPEPNQIEEE